MATHSCGPCLPGNMSHPGLLQRRAGRAAKWWPPWRCWRWGCWWCRRWSDNRSVSLHHDIARSLSTDRRPRNRTSRGSVVCTRHSSDSLSRGAGGVGTSKSGVVVGCILQMDRAVFIPSWPRIGLALHPMTALSLDLRTPELTQKSAGSLRRPDTGRRQTNIADPLQLSVQHG